MFVKSAENDDITTKNLIGKLPAKHTEKMIGEKPSNFKILGVCRDK